MRDRPYSLHFFLDKRIELVAMARGPRVGGGILHHSEESLQSIMCCLLCHSQLPPSPLHCSFSSLQPLKIPITNMQQLDEALRKKKQGCDSKQMEKKVKGRKENYLQLVIKAVERQGRRVRQN